MHTKVFTTSVPHHILVNPTSGLLSMLRSDWLNHYQAICRDSPLVAKSAGFETKTMEAESRFI